MNPDLDTAIATLAAATLEPDEAVLIAGGINLYIKGLLRNKGQSHLGPHDVSPIFVLLDILIGAGKPSAAREEGLRAVADAVSPSRVKG